MRKGLLVASFGMSLVVAGCGGSGGTGTGGTGGHGGSAGHGGSGGHAGSGGMGGGGHGGGATGGTAGGSGGHAGGGGATGGTAGGGGHAGSAGGTGGTGGSAGGTAGSSAGGAAGSSAGGAAGSSAGGAAGSSAGGAAGSSAGGAAGSSAGGVGGFAACGTNNSPNEGETCNSVAATGSCVSSTISTATPPTAAGGTLQAGTFDLTGITVYPGDSGSSDVASPVRKTVVLSNVTATSADMQEADQQGNFTRRQTGSLGISGHTLTFTQSCPPVDAGAGDGSGTVDFTYVGTLLTIIESRAQGKVVVEVYEKRP